MNMAKIRANPFIFIFEASYFVLVKFSIEKKPKPSCLQVYLRSCDIFFLLSDGLGSHIWSDYDIKGVG